MFWWYSWWGNWRCKWLKEKLENSYLMNENIDPIIHQVFTTINFDSSLTDEDYDFLIQILYNRSYHAKIKHVFDIKDICKIINSIQEDHNKKVWEIIFYMIQLKINHISIMKKDAEDCLMKIRKLIESNIKDKDEKYYLYLIAVHDNLFCYISYQINTSFSIIFSPEIQSIVEEVRKKVWNLYSTDLFC